MPLRVDGVLTPHEASRMCPVCKNFNPKPDEYWAQRKTPVCLYNPHRIKEEEKHKCLFAKHLGKPIIATFCDFCGIELDGLRFIEGVHEPPPPTVDGKYICTNCLLDKKESKVLRKKLGGTL